MKDRDLILSSLIFFITTVGASTIPTVHTSRDCPTGRYMDGRGKCALCFEFCGDEGCSGRSDVLGDGGCSSCWLGVEYNSSVVRCVSPYQQCGTGYYTESIPRLNHIYSRQTICRRCHPLCSTCLGPGVSYCLHCIYYSFEGMCVLQCPTDSQINHEQRTCMFPRGNRRQQVYYYRLYRHRNRINNVL